LSTDDRHLDERIDELAREALPLAVELLREVVRIPADYVDVSPEAGGDPRSGLSNHEGPRLEYLRGRLVELGAVAAPEDAGFDAFGNLWWSVEDPGDGVPAAEKTVVYLDGHTDTVEGLRRRWHESIGGGIDPYLGLTDPGRVDRGFLAGELSYLPPEDEWRHLLWGRGSGDQLGGVVSQVLATRILLALRREGALAGVVVRSYATVAEENNDGGGPMYVFRHELAGAGADRLPDVVVLTEPTGSAREGALGIYRGQRGRMQIEVEVTGRSCHGAMPWEGLNPLEHGGAILAEAAEGAARGDGFGDDPFLGAGTRTASMATLETPSDCAVPARFTFRLDRRLTPGEDPGAALAAVDSLPAVARARQAGLAVAVRVPVYEEATWRGHQPGNPQIYPGWVTPEDHPAIAAAVEAYRRVVSPFAPADGRGGALRREPRVSRWTFSTDGVGIPLPADELPFALPAAKGWIASGPFRYPAMFGLGPGIEQNAHKVGEYVDTRELAPAIAFLVRFPSLYRQVVGG
jgi:acetylornithine deacetylase/succinyl-diaminopimelate desuccinylase-like protein